MHVFITAVFPWGDFPGDKQESVEYLILLMPSSPDHMRPEGNISEPFQGLRPVTCAAGTSLTQ